MANHQLDFNVTIWSDDEEELLRLERDLKTLTGNNNPLIVATWLEKLASQAMKMSIVGSNKRLEVHSVDINWDDEEELPEDYYWYPTGPDDDVPVIQHAHPEAYERSDRYTWTEDQIRFDCEEQLDD